MVRLLELITKRRLKTCRDFLQKSTIIQDPLLWKLDADSFSKASHFEAPVRTKLQFAWTPLESPLFHKKYFPKFVKRMFRFRQK